MVGWLVGWLVGGAYGFSEAVYKAASEKISLSKMTFSHQMIRLIFVEQIYRAMTILNNEPYHHEYKNRLVHYIPFEMEIIPDIKNVKNLREEQQKEKEGELILKMLQPGDYLVLLDEHGKSFTSMEFATYLERKMHKQTKKLLKMLLN